MADQNSFVSGLGKIYGLFDGPATFVKSLLRNNFFHICLSARVANLICDLFWQKTSWTRFKRVIRTTTVSIRVCRRSTIVTSRTMSVFLRPTTNISETGDYFSYEKRNDFCCWIVPERSSFIFLWTPFFV